jgi:UDP-2,3-diacylglucosamine pyrophosphatase LpxH
VVNVIKPKLKSETQRWGLKQRLHALTDSEATERVRTLFLSDIHLGTRGCQAEQLLDLLKYYDAETIFLVGDIIDGWRLKSVWHWPPLHNVVVQKLLRKVRKGARIVYVPGNHDEFLRDYVGESFGEIDIVEEATYRLLDGRKALILHGDKFDTVVRNIKWLAHLGDWAYELAMYINRYLNIVRRKLGMPYWSFSAASKAAVKQAVSFIGAFEDAVIADAMHQGAQVVVCGHIHHAAIRQVGPVLYVNCGDWVESRTAIAEHLDGRLELIRWDEVALRPQASEQAVKTLEPAA